MKKQVLAFSIAIMQLMVSFSGTKVTAADFNNDNKQADCMDYISLSGSYLIHNQSDNGIWYDNNTISNAYISECFAHKDLLDFKVMR